MLVPTIDIIDDLTFEYKPGANSYRGGFSLHLDYKWIAQASWQQVSGPSFSTFFSGGSE